MLKKLFSRKNPYTTAIKKEIAEIKAISRDYEETRKQVLKNVETINALMGGKHGIFNTCKNEKVFSVV